MEKSRKQLFDDCYGRCHVQLQILATHPDYQRRGAGAALCNWGIEGARRRGIAVSVFASPMGWNLYSRLGFRLKAPVRMEVDGDDESIVVMAMIYEPKNAISWTTKAVAPDYRYVLVKSIR